MESFQAKEFRNRIGGAIRRLRGEENISAAYLAKVLGVTQPTISRIEAGTSSIAAEKLFLLASTFNRSLSYFVGEQSKLVVNEKDIIIAGLVFYGAHHLKSKAGINSGDYYKNYADLLNASLSESADPRIAHAIAATLYNQAALNQLNITRIVTTITRRRLVANLAGILEPTVDACNTIDRNGPRDKRLLAEEKLKELHDALFKEQTIYPLQSDLPKLDSQSIAIFINEGLRNE